jgi:hypothetical protein
MNMATELLRVTWERRGVTERRPIKDMWMHSITWAACMAKAMALLRVTRRRCGGTEKRQSRKVVRSAKT